MKTPEEYLREQGIFSLDTKKRYNEVIKWMQEYANQSKWVSVEDELPKKGQRVLCIQDHTKTATKEPLFAIFTGNYFIPPGPTIFADYEVGQSKWVNITYWQPLPEPPKL